MKFKYKFIMFVLAASTVTTTASIAYDKSQRNEVMPASDFSEDEYECSSNGFNLKVDTKTLYFEIEKNGVTWNSGKTDESDTKTTSLRSAFFTSPVSLYYLTATGGETYFSLNDEYHEFNNRITFQGKPNGFAAKIKTFDGKRADPNISVDFTLNVRLNDKGVDIYISDLVENESKSKLSKIVMYPGFGSTYSLNNGYFLLPDGSGALVDLSIPSNAQSALKLKTYDYDYGISTYSRSYTASQILTLPMYAIQNENAGIMAEVTSGEEYSELNSKVAGVGDDYNYTYFDFTYRDVYYSYQGIAESTKRPIPQEEINQYDPKVSYSLYDKKMTYSDYAQEYQAHLINNNALKKSNSLNALTRLEYLMAENEPALFGRSLVKMTSLDYVKDSVSSLLNEGKNYSVSLLGYSKDGLGGSYPNNFPADSRLGSKNDFSSLSKYLSDQNIDTNFVVDVVRAYENNGVKNSDLAMNKSQKFISTPDYYNGTNSTFNRLTLDATASYFNKTINSSKEVDAKGLDFMSLGSALFSNHYKNITSRKDAINKYKSLLQTYEGNIALRKPNMYMFDNFDSYLSMPIESSHFMMETEDIPFLEMVLSGYKNMYINSINLNSTDTNLALKLLENNVYPSYLVTEKDPILLKDSSTTNVYSSKFDDWSNDIKKTYKDVTEVLSNFVGAKFISHEKIANNVYKSTYNNGKAIIVNYSNTDYVESGITVSSKGYKVIYE